MRSRTRHVQTVPAHRGFVSYDDRGGVPQRVDLPAPAKAVSVGGWFTCVLDHDEDVYCWGDNAFGQCGSAGPAVVTTPQRVLHLEQAEGVTAGAHHACVWSRRAVLCWGRGNRGALGRACADASCPPHRFDEALDEHSR